MKIPDILTQSKDTVIDSVEGRVRGVYTKVPSAAQKKHDIHTQDVVLEDDNGGSVRVCIMRKAMHIPEDSKGRTFKFESTPGDNGSPKGLRVDIYENIVKLQAENACAIQATDKDVEVAKTSPKQDSRERGPMPPEVRPRTVNVEDHIACIVDIIRKMDGELGSSEIASGPDYSDILTRLSTTIYIQCAKEGLVKVRQSVPNNILLMADAAPQQTDEAVVADKIEAVPQARVSEAYIVGKSLADELTEAEAQEITSLGGYNWENIYDAFEKRVLEDYPKVSTKGLGDAYDECKAFYVRRTKRFNNAEFCRTILTGAREFIELALDKSSGVTKAAPAEAEDPTTAGYREPADVEDSIPF